jgi:quercetin dioxygenase-like cupin family protein
MKAAQQRVHWAGGIRRHKYDYVAGGTVEFTLSGEPYTLSAGDF